MEILGSDVVADDVDDDATNVACRDENEEDDEDDLRDNGVHRLRDDDDDCRLLETTVVCGGIDATSELTACAERVGRTPNVVVSAVPAVRSKAFGHAIRRGGG